MLEENLVLNWERTVLTVIRVNLLYTSIIRYNIIIYYLDLIIVLCHKCEIILHDIIFVIP